MSETRYEIHRAREADAESVARLATEFHAYLTSLGDPFPFRFTAEDYRRDGFGPRTAFEGLVAEVDGETVGYLLHHDGYDTDAGRRLLFVIDLYVGRRHRRLGIGRALMEAAASVARERHATDLVWTVLRANDEAAGFYARLGARRRDGLDLMGWAAARPP